MQANVAKYSFTRSQLLALASIVLTDAAYFGLTNPQQGSATIVIIIGGALVIITIYVVCWLAVHLFGAISSWVRHKERLIAMSLAIPLIYCLLMQSIGQLNTRDILAVVPIVVITYFYIGLLYDHTSSAAGSKELG